MHTCFISVSLILKITALVSSYYYHPNSEFNFCHCYFICYPSFVETSFFAVFGGEVRVLCPKLFSISSHYQILYSWPLAYLFIYPVLSQFPLCFRQSATSKGCRSWKITKVPVRGELALRKNVLSTFIQIKDYSCYGMCARGAFKESVV